MLLVVEPRLSESLVFVCVFCSCVGLAWQGASSKASETTSVEGEGTELPAEVVFILTVMSTGTTLKDKIVLGPE
jgi:hypothetical protein